MMLRERADTRFKNIIKGIVDPLGSATQSPLNIHAGLPEDVRRARTVENQAELASRLTKKPWFNKFWGSMLGTAPVVAGGVLGAMGDKSRQE
jgi:hypothetical protein